MVRIVYGKLERSDQACEVPPLGPDYGHHLLVEGQRKLAHEAHALKISHETVPGPRRFLVWLILLATALGFLSGMALAIYLLGIIGFSGSNIFYDALLVDVAPPGTYERTSALGYALGYLGGGLLFAFDVLMTLFPSWFGFADSAAAVRASFLSVAVWWALFAVPVALWVPEGPRTRRVATRSGRSKLSSTWP